MSIHQENRVNERNALIYANRFTVENLDLLSKQKSLIIKIKQVQIL